MALYEIVCVLKGERHSISTNWRGANWKLKEGCVCQALLSWSGLMKDSTTGCDEMKYLQNWQ
jgi:hypothetical protein